MGKGRRHIIRGIGAVAAVILISVATLATPYALVFAAGTDHEWARRADIGHAYGPVSALLAGLALLGVIASVRLQTAQRLGDKLLSKQQRHHDMMRYVFDDPMYSQCWGPKVAPEGVDERLYFYTNVILGEWQAAFEVGDLCSADIRHYAAMMFKSELPRMFWERHGYLRLSTTHRKATSEFAAIVAEEFAKAVDQGAPEGPYERPASRNPEGAIRRWLLLGAVGVAMVGATRLATKALTGA